tara:strand:+ start:288 stop:1079 length:792 start_codon:yes stop_codon:yes gene_type:complete
MKTWMKVVLGIFAAIALLVGFIFWLTSDVTKTGDDFFDAVQNEDIDAAYALLSDDFKAGTSKDGLVSYLAANALNNPREISWGSRMMTGGVAELKGTITTQGGSKIPLKLGLIDSDAGWRINTIEKEIAGFRNSSGDDVRAVPSAEKQRQMFRKTITVFAESLVDKSMKKLWDFSSPNLRRQISLDKFNEAYKYNFQFSEDYAQISQFSPIIDSSEVTEDGLLHIWGHYPTKPKSVHFHQVYIYQGIGWKLSGLISRVGAPPT